MGYRESTRDRRTRAGLAKTKLSFAPISSVKVYGPFFSAEPNVTDFNYIDMLENCLMPRLQQDIDRGYIFQKDEVPRTSISRLLPTSIARWLLGLDVVGRQLGHHDRLI